MPNESGLTPLAELSRQPIEVGSTGYFLFNRKGHKLQPELVQLSLLTRIANILEGHEGTLTARVDILLDEADDFRDLVYDLTNRPEPLTIVGWRLLGESSALEVSLSYTDGQALFLLGRRWQEFIAQRSQAGGPQQ